MTDLDPCLCRRLRGFRHCLDEFGDRIDLIDVREIEDAWTVRRSILAKMARGGDTKRIGRVGP